jgi:hypothetical protein
MIFETSTNRTELSAPFLDTRSNCSKWDSSPQRQTQPAEGKLKRRELKQNMILTFASRVDLVGYGG